MREGSGIEGRGREGREEGREGGRERREESEEEREGGREKGEREELKGMYMYTPLEGGREGDLVDARVSKLFFSR